MKLKLKSSRFRCLISCLASILLIAQQAALFLSRASSGDAPNAHVYVRPTRVFDLEYERRKSLEYVKSIGDTKRNLVFVHIPKNAGSTIEDVGAKQAKLSWGSCLFNHRPKRASCKKPIMLYPDEFEWPMKVGYWHIPPYYFPLMGSDPYGNADLFAIVRDPRERLLSEFYYICRKKLKPNYWDIIDCNRTRVHEPEYLNYWLQRELKSSKPTEKREASDLLFRNGHYTPQYDFIVSPDGVRVVDYVMHMERLNDEFQPLMKAYGINAAMPPKKSNAAREERDLSVDHLDDVTTAFVKDVYAKDLELVQALENRKT